MKKILLEDITKQAKEQRDKYQLYHNYLHHSHLRALKNYISAPIKDVRIPSEWGIDNKFNPFYVLKRNKQIAKSISKKILDGTYVPAQPFKKQIKKPNGGYRDINVYQIPDSAVSDRFYHNLLSKNKHRFSSNSYAYRNDRNIHFAIQDIANELNLAPRIFVAEFDFSDFFGSINHDFIRSQLRKNGFLISEIEFQVIDAFLKPFDKGIPLGTSISLFLANVACWMLDRELENHGLRFARYADDTIIWSKDYTKITKAFEIISEFSMETGIKINYNKSEGISLLQKQSMPSEFNSTKEFVEFLGYKISTDNISIKDKSIKKIKKQISYLLYTNLIQPIKVSPISPRNIPKGGLDKNFLSAIMHIRRYLYGNLTEETLKKYLNGTYKILTFKGIMSFYPLINDTEQLKHLDKWLLSTIMNIVKLRKKILVAELGRSFDDDQFPFNVDKDNLVLKCRNTKIGTTKGLMEIPSFLRIYDAMQKGLINEGIERVMNPQSGYYE
ncbi:reverse transcriptase domain-containing protein [Flavobacterium daemonense]|uniref:reverse transcriptase domain-containing protein n=1 Tax=Flavobacterium daemonense TaxID=1393049 RepID=UPI001186567F|nr:reverse transcriptase domain-containing protein [Flavobacterium daemonense]KAF2336324.1 RNA-dependent DNA polymerase [Flavobacterium daemonense]